MIENLYLVAMLQQCQDREPVLSGHVENLYLMAMLQQCLDREPVLSGHATAVLG